MATSGSSNSGSIISNNNNSNNSNRWNSMERKKTWLEQGIGQVTIVLRIFFLFQIKTTGRITPLMGHCLRNRYNGEKESALICRVNQSKEYYITLVQVYTEIKPQHPIR